MYLTKMWFFSYEFKIFFSLHFPVFEFLLYSNFYYLERTSFQSLIDYRFYRIKKISF